MSVHNNRVNVPFTVNVSCTVMQYFEGGGHVLAEGGAEMQSGESSEVHCTQSIPADRKLVWSSDAVLC